jgi:galactokinase
MNRNELREIFLEIYGRKPRFFRAPGRVNLIGEHTDYNDGFVLPFAIDREALAAGAARTDTRINAFALDINETFTFDLRDEAVKQRGNWQDYVEGTARSLDKYFNLRHGADLVFSSTVPIGAGLSSSAALEVSIGFALHSLNEIKVNPKELAFAAQEAEHEFVGIRSGIMDQFASVLCKENHALLLDCRSLETKQIPLRLKNALIAVCDTRVKHKLASSEYNTRRRECETGVEILKEKLPEINSLRDVGIGDFIKFQSLLPETIMKRCLHVITENERTLEAAENLEKGDLEKVGALMFASHESLRDDYEVSCAELDKLVEIARETKGVFGARMTGGGFGGCTVNLVRESEFANFQEIIRREYSETFGFEPSVFKVNAAEGAGEI